MKRLTLFTIIALFTASAYAQPYITITIIIVITTITIAPSSLSGDR